MIQALRAGSTAATPSSTPIRIKAFRLK